MSRHPNRTRFDVDKVDHPFNRSSSTIALVQALAAAKAKTSDRSEANMWWGLAEMMELALSDVKVMNNEYTRAANYLYELETRCGITKPAPARKNAGGAK